MAIARFPSIVLDCPDPGTLATLYGAMPDWKVDISPDWPEVRADYGRCLCFQQVEASTRRATRSASASTDRCRNRPARSTYRRQAQSD